MDAKYQKTEENALRGKLVDLRDMIDMHGLASILENPRNFNAIVGLISDGHTSMDELTEWQYASKKRFPVSNVVEGFMYGDPNETRLSPQEYFRVAAEAHRGVLKVEKMGLEAVAKLYPDYFGSMKLAAAIGMDVSKEHVVNTAQIRYTVRRLSGGEPN